MSVTVISILGAVTLALSVAGQSMTFSEMYDIESNDSYAAAADELLREKEADIKEERTEARSEGDAVAEAEADLLLTTLHMVKENANIQAVKRQQRQRKAAFLEEQWRQFQVNMLLKGLSAGASRIGMGKLRGTYMRGSNWPPDPSKSVALFDPKARQAVRILLESDRPILDVIKFSDDFGDALDIVLGGFSVLKSATAGDQAQTGEEAYGVVTEGLERLEDLEPLPDTIGAFIAISMVKQAWIDNPQIEGLSSDEQADFLIDQACKQLRELVEAEADLDRSDALRAAQRLLECPGAVDAPGAEDPEEETDGSGESGEETGGSGESEEEAGGGGESEEKAGGGGESEQDAPNTGEWLYEGTYSDSSGSSGLVVFYVYPDNQCLLKYRKTVDPNIGELPADSLLSTTASVRCTYENGSFILWNDGKRWGTGTFDGENVSGGVSFDGWSGLDWSMEFSGSRAR